MSDSDNVVEESLPQAEELPREDYEGRMAAFMDEQRADQEQVEEDSSPSATLSEEGETEPDSDESTEVEASAEDASAETEAKSDDESISKAAFLKRVNGLNATKRKLEKENLEAQREISEYREAFQILVERVKHAEGRLAEYEDQDPREAKILEYERQRQAEEIRAKLEAEHQERIKQMEQSAQLESRAEEIISEANYWADKYPTLTAEELVYKFRNSDKTLEDLAKSMHNARYKSLRTMFAKENKPSAPRKIKPQGSMSPIKGTSEDDMMDYLESIR